MPQYPTKRRKRAEAKRTKEIEDLRAEAQALEFIRNCGHVFDALLFYSGQSHLSEPERNEIRACMAILSRGGGM